MDSAGEMVGRRTFLLQTLGETRGFTVDAAPAVAVEGRTVSSTLIRRAIAGGDLETAARQLGGATP